MDDDAHDMLGRRQADVGPALAAVGLTNSAAADASRIFRTMITSPSAAWAGLLAAAWSPRVFHWRADPSPCSTRRAARSSPWPGSRGRVVRRRKRRSPDRWRF